MAEDMWRGWGYKFQWLLSYYLFTLMKEDWYVLDSWKKVSWKEFHLFAKRLKKFKDKCLEKYWADFQFKLDILVEWEELCLDDITFISDSWTNNIDNVIFIQVKTKWWDKAKTFSTSDGIYKAVGNFLKNLNFQNNKHKWNLSFFIITNRNLAKPLIKKFQSKSVELYLGFINYLKKIDNLEKKINKEIVLSMIKNEYIEKKEYLKVYSKSDIQEIWLLVQDLTIIFNSLSIIEEIDYDLLRSELIWHYGKIDFYENLERIEDLCWQWAEIHKWTPEFERYEQYKNTYFHPENWGKLIEDIQTMTKWKFI